MLLAMGLGSVVAIGSFIGLSRLWPQPETVDAPAPVESTTSDRVVALSFLPAADRRTALETFATQGSSVEQRQARYVLAADAVRQQKGAEALRWLDGLETRYPVLAARILALRAQAYTLERQDGQARQLWQQIITQFPQDGAAGEAYAVLGRTQPQIQDQALARLPAHPRTVDLAVARLKQSPPSGRKHALLMLIVRQGFSLKDYQTYLDRAVKLNALSPQEWEQIGFGYWEKLQYKEAGLAYSHAPRTSRNAYRAARGLQLGGEQAARQAYERMIAAFPQAPETPRALIRLADLSDDSVQAIAYLDRAIALATQLKRPEDSGDALARKARRLKKVNPAQQTTIETQLLEDWGQTTAAADLRWHRAWTAAQQQQLETARQWAQQIVQVNPTSEQAPRALFWSGKWAERLSNPTARQQDFSQLWRRYPESYYAWRVASLSGNPVGDFQSLQTLTPTLKVPTQRLPLTAGSAQVRELYSLGEGQAAWEQWQLEFQNRASPSLQEQLTDGLIRIAVGEYLDGIFMLSNLSDRVTTEPELQSQRGTVLALHQDPRYWQALYPIPYWPDIQRWSSAQSLNPVLVLGLMRQESRFTSDIKSVVGATGLMQLMPETAQTVAAGLKLKTYRLDNPSDNIRLGTSYLNATHQTFQGNSMLAIASYNAGPGSVDSWLKTLETQDADVFIETIPFDETQNYVKAVLGNYWNYLRLYSPQRS
jgi:soluble lytic murein transglycosylase